MINALEWLTEHSEDDPANNDNDDDKYFDFVSETGNDKNVFSASIYTTKTLKGNDLFAKNN